MLPLKILFSLCLAATLCLAAEHWDIQYQYKQLDSVLTLNDLAFPSAKRGVACGFTLDRKGKDRSFLIATSDGGNNWTEVPVKETCVSLFFLNDSSGWMVTPKGVWLTSESGRTWTKTKAPPGLLKVWFLDMKHGYGVGLDKTLVETLDGGDTWTPLPIVKDLQGDAKYTTFGEIEFQGRWGMVSGWNVPPRPGGPDWMETKRNGRRQLPNMSISVVTKDGGKTWIKTESSIFGQVTRLDIAPDGLGLGLIEFRDNFEFPSEVYGFNANGSGLRRVFRQNDRAITDVKQLPGSNRAIITGFETSGSVYRSPIPGKLKVLSSEDLGTWSEMEVDYRAVAHQAFIAAPDAKNIWIVADTGMILKLVND